jgi:hypothetical protein
VLSTNILERHHEDWQRDIFMTVELRAPASIKYLQEGVPLATVPRGAIFGGGDDADAAAGSAGSAPASAGAGGAAGATPRAGARALGSLELRELRELRSLLNKGLLSGQGALNALLGTELALLGAGDAPALPPVRASPALHARYAAGRAFFATDVCRAAAHAHFTPGALEVLARIADPGAADAAHAHGAAHAPDAALWLLPLPAALAGRTYGALFAHLGAQGVTPLGLYRQPGGAGELPYVFTAPPPWVALQRDDAAYVLAPPAWAAEHIPAYAAERAARAAATIQAAWRARAGRLAARPRADKRCHTYHA